MRVQRLGVLFIHDLGRGITVKRLVGVPAIMGVAVLLVSGCGVTAEVEKAVEATITAAEETATSAEDKIDTEVVDVFEQEPVTEAPTGVSASAGNAQAKVSWSAPASSGSAPITGYTVSSTPGGFVCTTTGSKNCTVTGLVNGTPYSFVVIATTDSGTGAPSVASNTVTPTAPVPGAPQGVSAQPGNGQVKVSWSAPTVSSALTITGYSVSSSPGGFTCTTAGATSCIVSGLVNDTPHTFTVTAITSTGTSAPSAPSNTVTPSAPLPGAPVGVSATAGNGQAKVSWSSPTSTGGAKITGYTVTSSPGGFLCTTTGAKSCTVKGLVNDIPHTFTVTAKTATGVSDSSAPSNSVTPSVPVVSELAE
jgi:Fibronectin type III domain